MGSGDPEVIHRWQRLAEFDRGRAKLQAVWNVFRRSIGLNTTDQGGLFFGFGEVLWPAWDRQRGRRLPGRTRAAPRGSCGWCVPAPILRSTPTMLNEGIQGSRRQGLDPMSVGALVPG
jgi:hypothetical protein